MSNKGSRIKAQRHDPEDQYRLLFESNPHPMWVYDLDTLEFLTVNEAAIHRYGYSRDEFIGMTIKDIRPPEDIQALLENVSRVTEGLDDAGIWRHKKKDGSIIFVEIVSHTINFNGRRAEMVLANDITKRKQAEDALKLSEEKYRGANKLQREKTIAELYGFIVSALPVFASNVPSQVRHNLIRNFAERFDKNIRPRFEEEIKQLPCGLSVEKSINEGVPEKLDIFMLWLERMFENINIRTNISFEKTDQEGIRANLEFLNCSWEGEAKVNPIFCFICRTIVLRSFTWTKQKGSAQQKSSIANGSKTCRFEIQVKSPVDCAGII
ncbi:MAG TPA: methanogen output domain 1-containing protein [Candidatus Methanoperedens sp.]|nr:methanogen output domain 1-containing protein [Candidatus Methanoperedens sp.]